MKDIIILSQLFLTLSFIVNCTQYSGENNEKDIVQSNGYNRIQSVTDVVSNNNTIVLSFGEFEEGDNIEGLFSLINDYDFPVELKLLKQSCGCAVVDYSQKSIETGDYSIITAIPNTSREHVIDNIEINVIDHKTKNIIKTINLLVDGHQKERVKLHNLSFALGSVELGKTTVVYNLLSVPDEIYKSDFKIQSVTIDNVDADIAIKKLKSEPNNPHIYQIKYTDTKTNKSAEIHTVYLSYQYNNNLYHKIFTIESGITNN